MIISPPFLPARDAAQTDDRWLASAMPAVAARGQDTRAPEGSFPLSFNFMWHNGMHLQAPTGNGASLPVRAIADGTVIYVSPAPTKPVDDVEHAQNYNPFTPNGAQKTAAWTDNGCVIVKHATSIGANAADETVVEFYSLYMHLSVIGKTTPGGQTAQRVWTAGDAVWRKDEIGTPGQVYGHSGQIHFEICCDATNLQRLIGREPNWIEPVTAPATLPVPTTDGRIDSLFGSMYFYLPADTPTDEGVAKPINHLRRAVSGNNAGTTLQAALWVKMTYDRGACSFETFSAQGAAIGTARTQANEEYDLYKEATDRHNALPAAAKALSSPSAWYELLRFGRNIGRGPADADKDPLPSTPTATAAHWRRITGPNGKAVWADLNAAGSFKLSDADFPALMGWNCVDDDTTPNDQRCDSEHLKAVIADSDVTNANRTDVEVLTTRLGRPDVQQKLKRTICKFPSEWDQSSITTRYAFVKDLPAFKEAPEAWTPLEAHLKALSFTGLPTEYLNADWRFDPREFMGHMRRCGWLSARELSQLLPRRHGSSRADSTEIPWATSQARFAPYLIDLNRTLRKYLIQGATRQTHFLAQTYIETAMWRTVEEIGRAHQQKRKDGSVYWPAPAMQFYNAFYGRGIMQLTWAGNYDAYGDYRAWASVAPNHIYADARITRDSQHYFADPRDRSGNIVGHARIWAPRFDPALIANSTFNSCDSGAHYWVSKNTGRELLNINRVSDLGVTTDAIGRASVLVNGGGYGFSERQAYAPFVLRFLGDGTETEVESTFNVIHSNKRHPVYVNFTPQRPR